MDSPMLGSPLRRPVEGFDSLLNSMESALQRLCTPNIGLVERRKMEQIILKQLEPLRDAMAGILQGKSRERDLHNIFGNLNRFSRMHAVLQAAQQSDAIVDDQRLVDCLRCWETIGRLLQQDEEDANYVSPLSDKQKRSTMGALQLLAATSLSPWKLDQQLDDIDLALRCFEGSQHDPEAMDRLLAPMETFLNAVNTSLENFEARVMSEDQLCNIFGGEPPRISRARALLQGVAIYVADDEVLLDCFEACDSVEELLTAAGWRPVVRKTRSFETLNPREVRAALAENPLETRPSSSEPSSKATSPHQQSDASGVTPLMSYAAQGEVCLVRSCLEDRAYVDEKDQAFGRTALLWSAAAGETDAVRLLLEHRANIHERSKVGLTALLSSAEEGHIGTLRVLLESQASAEERDSLFGRTALMLSAHRGHIDAVRVLLDANAQIDQTDHKCGMTALMWAALAGKLDMVVVLTRARSSVDAVDKRGRTALCFAENQGLIEFLHQAFSLQRALNELGLGEKMPQLAALGVETVSDVLLMVPQPHQKALCELGLAGLTLVQIRKLQIKVRELHGTCHDGQHSLSEEDLNLQNQMARIREVTPHPVQPQSLPRGKKRMSAFWRNQVNRPFRLILIRNGESEGDVDRNMTRKVPDHMLHLTAEGRRQALDAGRRLRELVGSETIKFTVSPYVRAQETYNGMKQAWGDHENLLYKRTDVRLREQEFGNFDAPDIEQLHKEKKSFGQFYYRFPQGESVADCFDRASSFFETTYRDWADNAHQNHVIIGHGMMILCLVMRLFRHTPDEWANWDRLKHCEFVVMERPADEKYHISFTWVDGQEKDYNGLRSRATSREPVQTWDGSLGARRLKSLPTRDSHDLSEPVTAADRPRTSKIEFPGFNF